MVLHHEFRVRHVRTAGIGGEVRHGVTSGVSREMSLNKHVTPHLRREYVFQVRLQTGGVHVRTVSVQSVVSFSGRQV